jgi:uroporphyrinogen decarboxylase
MSPVDFERHNAEVKEVWDAYRRREPVRVPVVFGINPRYTMFDHPANPRRFTFEQFFNDPQVMLERQLEHQEWVRLNVPQDMEMGLPPDGWDVAVNFFNSYEAAWLGCALRFDADQVPDTTPLWSDDRRKWMLLEQGIPDPFTGGLMQKNWEFYDYFLRKQAEGWTWKGLPIQSVTPCGLGTDGPLTVACNLRGATEFMTDLRADPDYAWKLLEFVTEATIVRLQAYRRKLGQPLKTQDRVGSPRRSRFCSEEGFHPGWGFADDSVQLISTRMYEDLILPFHRRLVETFSEGGPISIHLCGDATRHFRFLRDTLNIRSFDTGFPVEFGWLREQVGPDVEIQGGPTVTFLQRATPPDVRAEVKRILTSGITEGGRFILREANNMPPGIPLENLQAMYEAAKEYGRLE